MINDIMNTLLKNQPSDEAVHAEALAACGRINILIAGNTGVGKSTLLNAVFGEDVVPTGTGRPMTQGITEHRSPSAPLTLFDTRGFEAGDKEALTSIGTKLAELRTIDRAGAHIHVAWLCISTASSRIEPAHTQFLHDMAELKIPVLVVLTKSSGESMRDVAEELAQPSAAIVEVLAQPQRLRNNTEVGAFGLEELVDATYNVADEGVRSAFAAAQATSLDLKKFAARKTMAKFAAVGGSAGAVPVPLLDAVLVLKAQRKMLAAIDLIFGLPAHHEATAALKGQTTTLVSGLGTISRGLAAKYVAETTGAGFIAGMAIGSAVSAAATGTLGEVYVRAIVSFLSTGKPMISDDAIALVMSAIEAARPKAAVRA